MTFAELQRGVFDDLQYSGLPKPGVQDRVRRYLNEGLERVLRRPRLKNLRFGTVPFTSVPERGFYGVPAILERIDYIIDLTNRRRLRFRTRDWYRHLDPAQTTQSSTPSVWIPEGLGPMLRTPRMSGAFTPIWIHTQIPTDNTQTIRIKVAYYYGDEYSLEKKLDGTTYVGWMLEGPIRITHLALTGTTSGVLYVVDDNPPITTGPGWPSDSDPVARIEHSETTSRRLGIRLYPTPSAAIQYELEGQRVIPRMEHDEDEPPFHNDFHEMLQCYARARFYRKDGRLQQSGAEMAEFERFALDLTAHIEYPTGYRPVAGKLSADGTGWSDLGSDYPADRHSLIND